MAPKCSRKGTGKATARATMPTSVINWLLLLNRDCIKGFIPEHIHGLILIYNVCGIKDESAWDHFYDIIFPDAVTTRHFLQFQPMWLHHRSRVHLFGSGGQPSAHIWGKCLIKPATKWTIGGRTTPMPSGIEWIAPICRQPAREWLSSPASVSLGTVAMISGQRLSRQAAGSTRRVTSCLSDHWIGMR